jgi:hypothetical protein
MAKRPEEENAINRSNFAGYSSFLLKIGLEREQPGPLDFPTPREVCTSAMTPHSYGESLAWMPTQSRAG